jgi:uncharacterized membrane protein YgdD (TMEM256/DUF423 family)
VSPTFIRRLAAVFGFLAVGLGAIGAHMLKGLLLSNGFEPYWQKAVLYHLAHSVVLLALSARPRASVASVVAFSLGMLLFSGSLYLYSIWQIRWLMFLTPFGGVSLMVGWGCLLVSRADPER